jgi:hypothetical protein
MLIVLKNCVKICQNPTHTLIRKSAASGPVRIVADSAAIKLAAEDETMYGFASAVSTVMLSSIGGAIGIMFLMTGSALFYRSAMGGKKEKLTLRRIVGIVVDMGMTFALPLQSHFRVGCRLNQKNAGPVPTSRTVAKTLRFVFLTFR